MPVCKVKVPTRTIKIPKPSHVIRTHTIGSGLLRRESDRHFDPFTVDANNAIERTIEFPMLQLPCTYNKIEWAS